jgi:hypothetical protein
MKQFLLWTLAVILMAASVIYQRSTGPTYPKKGKLEANGTAYKYKLLRSQETTDSARIELPVIEGVIYEANLHYKRYGTMDALTTTRFKMTKEGKFTAQLPKQPAAGKMEYFITGSFDGKVFQIPDDQTESIVLRYKDPVPNGILIPHIFFMFFAVLLGLRAGLSAIVDVNTMRRWVMISLIGMTLGGMILGPMVQKHAFGEYWTGFPFGGDFTDNKTLIMWLAWVIAFAVIGLKPKKNEMISRAVVIIATVVMTAVYLIPHSMGGSSLDYSKVDQGIHPSEAIKTGKE